jgi:hypothetical protein
MSQGKILYEGIEETPSLEELNRWVLLVPLLVLYNFFTSQTLLPKQIQAN